MEPSPDMSQHKPADTVMRILDVLAALVLLVLTAIPMLLISVFIYVEDRGPVFFRQQRIGQGLKPFQIVKFRTMTHDKHRFLGGSSDGSDRVKFQTTKPGDARITKVGKILRPIHLDELPQILNVLTGEMSFVGVRPDTPVQIADYTPQEWTDRHVLRPGITGLAQIDPKIASTADRTARDIEWVRTRSLSSYLRILMGTFSKVLKRNSL